MGHSASCPQVRISIVSPHTHSNPAGRAGQGQACHHRERSNDLPKVKRKKVLEQGWKEAGLLRLRSEPDGALQHCFAGHPGEKVGPDTQIRHPLWPTVGSALPSRPKPHPPHSCFSDVFCNVILLLFLALGQTSRSWFPF